MEPSWCLGCSFFTVYDLVACLFTIVQVINQPTTTKRKKIPKRCASWHHYSVNDIRIDFPIINWENKLFRKQKKTSFSKEILYDTAEKTFQHKQKKDLCFGVKKTHCIEKLVLIWRKKAIFYKFTKFINSQKPIKHLSDSQIIKILGFKFKTYICFSVEGFLITWRCHWDVSLFTF